MTCVYVYRALYMCIGHVCMYMYRSYVNMYGTYFTSSFNMTPFLNVKVNNTNSILLSNTY